MSKFFEAIVALCWIAILANEVFLSLWADDTFVLATAVLSGLMAIVYEMRERGK